ncbi:MAG: glutamate racemase [Proteobacteria bacterium]|nr:glutamate racemase [Pseudomonadota bacterium]
MEESKIDRPIGVFDSGVGGLTVLDAVRQALPHEDLVYLGDTARVPYGNRTPQTIVRYATSCARQLVNRHVKAIVIACNTASAHALDALNEAFDVPVFGVIEPASRMAVDVSKSKCIGIIGTRATIASQAYTRAIQAIDPNAHVYGLACPLFVPLVEEGWAETDVARLVVRKYLEDLIALSNGHEMDTLILGCTHYPVLKSLIQETLASLDRHMVLCDCAQATAKSLVEHLKDRHLLRQTSESGWSDYLVTDDPQQFSAVGRSFMHEPPVNVSHIDIV